MKMCIIILNYIIIINYIIYTFTEDTCENKQNV